MDNGKLQCPLLTKRRNTFQALPDQPIVTFCKISRLFWSDHSMPEIRPWLGAHISRSNPHAWVSLTAKIRQSKTSCHQVLPSKCATANSQWVPQALESLAGQEGAPHSLLHTMASGLTTLAALLVASMLAGHHSAPVPHLRLAQMQTDVCVYHQLLFNDLQDTCNLAPVCTPDGRRFEESKQFLAVSQATLNGRDRLWPIPFWPS